MQGAGAMFLLKVFAGATAVLTGVYYWATQYGRHPLPLWPDSVIVGASVAVLVTAIAARFSADRKAARHLRNVQRLLWKGPGQS